MSQHPWFLDRAYAVQQPLSARFMPRVQPLLESSTVDFGRLAHLQTAQSAEPDPLTLELLAARTPYMSQARIADGVAATVEAGLLAAVPGGYRLTDAGRAITDGVAHAVAEGTAQPPAVALERLERLDALLARQVDACSAVVAHDAVCLQGSRTFDPGPDAPVLSRIRRHINDLVAFRDDAHMAAWRPLGLPGHAWEAFSHVWGENVFGDAVATPEALADKLGGFRGYDADGYRAALRLATDRGWLAEADGAFSVTDEGRRVRQVAEVETDRHYFAPWRLSDDEAAELEGLLEEVATQLAAEAETALASA